MSDFDQPLFPPPLPGAPSLEHETTDATHMNVHSRWTVEYGPQIPRELDRAAQLVFRQAGLRQAAAQGPCLDARCTCCGGVQLFARPREAADTVVNVWRCR